MADTTKPLVCKQCGYANEGERVYCHNCGTKLDRSLLPATSEIEESPEKKQKRIKKIVSPKRGFFAGSGKTFIFTMLSALLVAVLLLIAMQPDDVPAAGSNDILPDVSPTMELEDALSQTTAQPLQFKQDDINAFLASKIKGEGNGMLGDSVKLVRAFAILDDDRIRITADETIFGLHVYSTIYYKLEIANNKLQATVKGGSLGRLQIHPNVMKNLSSIFDKIWQSSEMKQDKRLLDECKSVDVHKGVMDIVTLPAAQ